MEYREKSWRLNEACFLPTGNERQRRDLYQRAPQGTRVGSGKAGTDLRGKAAGTAIRYLLRTADALLRREARCLERRGGA